VVDAVNPEPERASPYSDIAFFTTKQNRRALAEPGCPLRDARDLLLVANRDNPKALSDFTYNLDDSVQAKPKPNPRPKLARV
jgi:hypothetical protein